MSTTPTLARRKPQPAPSDRANPPMAVGEDTLLEPSDEEILDDIRAALIEVKQGKTRPIHELLAEVRHEYGDPR